MDHWHACVSEFREETRFDELTPRDDLVTGRLKANDGRIWAIAATIAVDPTASGPSRQAENPVDLADRVHGPRQEVHDRRYVTHGNRLSALRSWPSITAGATGGRRLDRHHLEECIAAAHDLRYVTGPVPSAPFQQNDHAGREAQPKSAATYEGQRLVEDPLLSAGRQPRLSVDEEHGEVVSARPFACMGRVDEPRRPVAN